MRAAASFSVGLTGGIGSGKSTVADLFAERGVAVVDTDQIAHQLTAPGGAAITPITEAFGPAFILPDGAMNRGMMRDHVFSDPAARQSLEAILHPLIGLGVEQAARDADGCYLIYVVPLLVESGRWRARVNRILVVDCPEAVQIARVRQRSKLAETQVRAIMATQASRAQRNAAADDLIDNSTDTAALLPQVERLHARYLALAAAA
jgi:dephospho-CoA kinase